MEFVCFVWISEQKANFALCNTKRFVFMTEVDSVYCAVHTESLHNTYVYCVVRTESLYNTYVYCAVRTESLYNTDMFHL